MNVTVFLSLLSVLCFTIAASVLIWRWQNTGLKSGVFAPLLFSILLYDFIVISNFFEHTGITSYFDPIEDIAEIVFTLVFLFFVNNWRRDRSEKRFREIFKLAPMSLAEITRDGRVIMINEILARKLKALYGITVDDIPTIDKWWEFVYPDPEFRKRELALWEKSLTLAYDTGTEIKPVEREIALPDGSKRVVIVSANVIGRNLLLSMVDITSRKQKEAARLQNLELLRATFNATPDGILVINHEMKVTQANRQFYEMWRISEALQQVDDEATLREFVLDQLEDPAGFRKTVDTLYHSRIQDVYEIALKDGRTFECYTAPMVFNENEIGRVWDFRDISKQKQAEVEQERLQKQLLQAQKLEAIGILAGGVAHDFNNILGAIIGYAELTMEEMAASNPFRENVSKILDAAQRSASLTRQLLIFARKETVTPIVIDLNASVETMLKMLRRIIGEDIELAWMPSRRPCTVKMDPSQLDQILANLCVNAREAISDIGQITIKTETVAFDNQASMPHLECVPGDYVKLSVIDNGNGMDKDTAQHVFEPFFTTKGVGRGTGLGLATVYGIVKQSKGFITIYSEPGTGTTFDIYIPFHDEAALSEQAKSAETIPHGREETILMVEDDPALIEMSQRMLERLGYHVLTATTPKDALMLAEENKGEIHLFLSDVVMPEMNGRELINRLLLIRPGVKHLFMSGYTADVIVHRGISEDGAYFIQKPFSLKDLAVKIREVLASPEKQSTLPPE